MVSCHLIFLAFLDSNMDDVVCDSALKLVQVQLDSTCDFKITALMLLSAEGIFFVLGKACFQVVTDQYRNYAVLGDFFAIKSFWKWGWDFHGTVGIFNQTQSSQNDSVDTAALY